MTLLEIQRTADLDHQLDEFLRHRCQFPVLTEEDIATPETIARYYRSRRRDAQQAVRELWTLLEANAVKPIDLDITAAIHRLTQSAVIRD